MAQTYTTKLLDAAVSVSTGPVCTNQDNYELRSIYLSGAFNATVKIEVSPDATGSDWAELASLTAAGVTTYTAVCKRIRARVSAYTDGAVTVKMVARDSM